jgi:hypothetical protein
MTPAGRWVLLGVGVGAVMGAGIAYGGERLTTLVPCASCGSAVLWPLIGAGEGALIGAVTHVALLIRSGGAPDESVRLACGLALRLFFAALLVGICTGGADLLINGLSGAYASAGASVFALAPAAAGLHIGLFIGGGWHLLAARPPQPETAFCFTETNEE